MERKVNLEHYLIRYGLLTGDCPSSSPSYVNAAMVLASMWLGYMMSGMALH